MIFGTRTLSTQLTDITRKNRIKTRHRDDYLYSFCELSSEQVHECTSAPGTGNRVVVKYASIATNGDAGEAIMSGTMNASTVIITKLYLTKTEHISATNISIPLDENTNINMTSTGTGTDKIVYTLNYIIEGV